MPDEYNQSPRVEYVGGNVNYYFNPPPGKQPPQVPPRRLLRVGKWAWVGAGVAAVLGGTLVTTRLNARPVYYCASHHDVKYHTDPTCHWLRQCGTTYSTMPLGQAREQMAPCKMCHH